MRVLPSEAAGRWARRHLGEEALMVRGLLTFESEKRDSGFWIVALWVKNYDDGRPPLEERDEVGPFATEEETDAALEALARHADDMLARTPGVRNVLRGDFVGSRPRS